MAVLFIDGFEHGRAGSGLVNVHDVSQGGNTVGTTTVRTGLRSWECIHTGVTRNCGMNVPAGNRVAAMSFYVRLTAFPPSSSSSIAFFNNATANGSLAYNVPTGKFQVGVAGGTFLDVGPTVALNTWYLVDLLFDSSGTTYSVKGRIDGGTEVESTRAGLAAADITIARLGTPGASGANYSAYFDDWVIMTGSGEYPLGAHSVVSLIPNADGSHNIATAGDFDSNTSVAFSNSTTNGWSYIAHRPLQVANTPEQTIRQDVNGASNYMEFLFENLPGGTDTVGAVRVYAGHVENSATGATLAEMRLMLADATEVLTTGSLSAIDSTEDPGTTAQLRKRMTIAPSGGWDRTKVDGLKVRVGYKSATPIVGIFDSMVEVLLLPSGAAPTDLVVADGAHGHAADSPSITQTHALAVADARHATHIADTFALTQQHTLGIQEARSTHAADNVVVTEVVGAVTLAVADARNTHTADALGVLAQQHPPMVVDDARSTHAADSVPITKQSDLVPAETRHTPHTADAPSLVQQHTLVVADARSVHASDPVTLNVATSLVVADARSTHASDPVALTQLHTLVVNDARDLHASDGVGLVQQHTLVPSETRHTHTADSVGITKQSALEVQDGAHTHAGDNVSTSSAGSLGPADTRHGLTSDAVTITQVHTLVVADARSTHASDPVGVLPQQTTLVVADARHLHAGDHRPITQVHVLTPSETRHLHAADNVAASGAGSVGPADARHGLVSDVVGITQVHTLVVADARSIHAADAPAIAQVHALVVADARHVHLGDHVGITAQQSVAVADAHHGVTSDTPTLGYGVPPSQDFDRTEGGVLVVTARAGLEGATPRGGVLVTTSRASVAGDRNRGGVTTATPDAATMQRTTGGAE